MVPTLRKRLAPCIHAFTTGVFVGAALAGLVSTARHRATYSAILQDQYVRARINVIRGTITQTPFSTRRYLIIGDSIVERARLRSLCGCEPINAGIGHATIQTFQHLASELAFETKPEFIIVALGANIRDGGPAEYRHRLEALLASLRPTPILLIPVPPSPGLHHAADINRALRTFATPVADPILAVHAAKDGIHLLASDYLSWHSSIQQAAEKYICPQLPVRSRD